MFIAFIPRYKTCDPIKCLREDFIAFVGIKSFIPLLFKERDRG